MSSTVASTLMPDGIESSCQSNSTPSTTRKRKNDDVMNRIDGAEEDDPIEVRRREYGPDRTDMSTHLTVEEEPMDTNTNTTTTTPGTETAVDSRSVTANGEATMSDEQDAQKSRTEQKVIDQVNLEEMNIRRLEEIAKRSITNLVHAKIESAFNRASREFPTPAMRQLFAHAQVMEVRQTGEDGEVVFRFQPVRAFFESNSTTDEADLTHCKKLLAELQVALANNAAARTALRDSCMEDSVPITFDEPGVLFAEDVRIQQEIKKQKQRLMDKQRGATEVIFRWKTQRDDSTYDSTKKYRTLSLSRTPKTSNLSSNTFVTPSPGDSADSERWLFHLVVCDRDSRNSNSYMRGWAPAGGHELLEWLSIEMGALPVEDESKSDNSTDDSDDRFEADGEFRLPFLKEEFDNDSRHLVQAFLCFLVDSCIEDGPDDGNQLGLYSRGMFHILWPEDEDPKSLYRSSWVTLL